MAMIKCPECNDEVSSQASKCPKCGVRISKPKRSFMGNVFKWIFIAFNAIMAIWMFNGLSTTRQLSQAASTSFEQAGVAIGTGIVMTMILVLWVLGDIILGLPVLFTRPKD